MAVVHSHDSEDPMGWIGKGINTILKALTGVLSKEDGQVKSGLKGIDHLQLQLPMGRHPHRFRCCHDFLGTATFQLMTIATGDEDGSAVYVSTLRNPQLGFPLLMLNLNASYHMMTPVTLSSTDVEP